MKVFFILVSLYLLFPRISKMIRGAQKDFESFRFWQENIKGTKEDEDENPNDA